MKVTYTYTDTLQVITKLCSEIILKIKETSSLAVVSKPGQESVGRKTQAAMSEYTPAVDFKVFSRIVGYILRVNSIWMIGLSFAKFQKVPSHRIKYYWPSLE